MPDTTLNPLLQPWNAPFGLPPFADIHAEHFEPAFDEALRQHRAEIDLIGSQAEPPSFDNTVAAFDRSGRLLARVSALFENLTVSQTSPALQAVQTRLAPLLARHDNEVHMHPALFARLDALHERRDELGLAPQPLRLLERMHFEFVRAGARLAPAAQARYREVMQRLAELTTAFAQNVLADESSFQLLLQDEADAAGLPDWLRASLRQAAADRGVAAPAMLVTLARSHVGPFLTHSKRRDLREAAWRAWVERGAHPGAHDNRGVATQILQWRTEQARLHGYASYADYALADTMAGQQSAVAELLTRVWEPAKARAADELADLQALAGAEVDTVEPWDWRFYAERLRRTRFAIDDSEVKPYFSLEALCNALFDCADRLFGLRFTWRPDLPAYHPDVRVYEVTRADGEPVGLFLHDNFARAGKRSGAWMNSLRPQARGADGRTRILPIVLNNNNFAKAGAGQPNLLGFDDARTLFHEFGHGLHGLLSDVEFERLSGTNVLRDFVELPSQMFEHWLVVPEVLRRHARHVQTGEPMPQALIDKLHAARRFNQGWETVRYAASALVDMAAHAQTAPVTDLLAFEQAELARLGAPAVVGMNHRLSHFQHLFSDSGYAAGYYVYLWAEVLEADGYAAFTEVGDPFDPAVAQRLLHCIYAAGNSVDPRAAYRAFRGRDAQIEPMLRQRGLLADA